MGVEMGYGVDRTPAGFLAGFGETLQKESPPAARPSGFESWRGAISLPRNAKSKSATRMSGLVRADLRRIVLNSLVSVCLSPP